MKTQRVEIEKIADYIKVSREYMLTGWDRDDLMYDQLTVQLHGFVASMAKEEGEFTVYFKRPTFFDWLFRRIPQKKVSYSIRQLMKVNKLILPDNIRVIEIPIFE